MSNRVCVFILFCSVIYLFYVLKKKEKFLSQDVLVEKDEFNVPGPIKLYPAHALLKYERDINNKNNKVLLDVNELMNCEKKNFSDIYDYTSVNKDNNCFKNLGFW